jgi:hypothetical protein
MIFRVAALGIGALAMYYFDPLSGKRRRALLRDKFVHYRHQARHLAKGTVKHASNRAHGIVAEARSAVERRSNQRPQPDRRDAEQRWPVDPVEIDRT